MRRFERMGWGIGLAVVVWVVGAGSAMAAEDEAGAGAWTEAMPPETTLVAKFESEGFEAFAEALSERIDGAGDRRIFAAESPMSAGVASFVSDEVDDFANGDSEFLASISFAHVDPDRPLVIALSMAGHGYFLESVANGRPPTDGSRLVDGPVFRLIVPATDAAALRDELETTCDEVVDFQCEPSYRMEVHDEHVWIDFTPTTDNPRFDADEAFPTDGEFFERRTPAVEAFLSEGTGAAVYSPAEGWLRTAAVAEGGSVIDQMEEIAESSGEKRVFDIRQARRDIAEAMLSSDLRSPATREIEDATAVARADDRRNALVEFVQTYTRYGGALAEAGEIDTELPTYGLARSVVSGEWRYDVETAFGRASSPDWMTDPLLGESPVEGVWRVFEETDGFVAFAAALNHPLSALAGAAEVLDETGVTRLVEPEALGSLVAGTFSLDVDPLRIARGRPGVTGGVALAFRSGAEAAVERMIEVGKGMLGMSVSSETKHREGTFLQKLRLDHDGAFTATGESVTTRFKLRLNIDRLRAKVEMMGRDVSRSMRGVFALGRLVDGGDLTVDAEQGYRYTRMRFGQYRGATLSPSERSVAPLEPEGEPTCYREAVRASKRLYIGTIDQGPYYPSRRGLSAPNGDDSGEEADPEPPTAEFGPETRKTIDELVGKLGDLESTCDEEVSGKSAEKIGDLRAYWQGVLDGRERTYPQ